MPNWQNTVVFLWSRIWKEKCAHRQNNIQSLETNLEMLCFSWFTVSQGSSSLRATFFQHLLNLSKEKEKTFWRQTFAFVRHNRHYISLKVYPKNQEEIQNISPRNPKKLLRNPKKIHQEIKKLLRNPKKIIQKSKFHRETKKSLRNPHFSPEKKDFFENIIFFLQKSDLFSKNMKFSHKSKILFFLSKNKKCS